MGLPGPDVAATKWNDVVDSFIVPSDLRRPGYLPLLEVLVCVPNHSGDEFNMLATVLVPVRIQLPHGLNQSIPLQEQQSSGVKLQMLKRKRSQCP